MARVLVTGVTGLVGSHLKDRLLERGDAVRALVRPGSSAAIPHKNDVELVLGELGDPHAIERAVDGVEVVFHCAARPPLGGTEREFFRDNVQGTEHLLRAALERGADRFMHVSTVDVYGYGHLDGADESAPFRSDGLYSRSKIEAERVVMDFHRRHGLPVSIVRPCLIYGPRDRHLLPTVLRLLSRDPVPLVCGGEVLLDVVYAGDVANALIQAAESPSAIGQTYNITDGARRTLYELVQSCADVLGRTPRYVRLPYSLAYGSAALVSGLSAWLKFSTPPMLRWEVIKAMGHDRHFDISKSKRELGYRPQTPLDLGLRRALSWHLENLPRVARAR